MHRERCIFPPFASKLANHKPNNPATRTIIITFPIAKSNFFYFSFMIYLFLSIFSNSYFCETGPQCRVELYCMKSAPIMSIPDGFGSSAKFRILKKFKNKNPIPIFDFGIRRQSETEKCGRTCRTRIFSYYLKI